MSTAERPGRGTVGQAPPAPTPPHRHQQQQQQQQQVFPDQNSRFRLDSYTRIARSNLLSLSTRDRRLACVQSRAVSARPCKLRQDNPTRSSFLLLVFAFLTAPGLRSIFHDFHLWAGRDERGSGFGIGRIGVRAAECSQDAPRHENVNNETFISTMFACENGEFNVSWEGIVNISETIYIGHGTIVRIFGESSMPSIDSVDASDLSISPSPVVSNSNSSNSNGSSTDVDLDVEVERLSRDLNLPQELTSAAVGSVGLVNGSGSGESIGPIFFVDGGELHLESLAIRRGYAVNSTSNGTLSGGGIHAYNSSVSVSGCEFEENFAYFLGGGIYADLSTLTINNTVFRGNRAGYNSSAGDEDANGAGGGIACVHSNLSINGCLFDDNYANSKGGGVHIGVGRVSVVDSLFFNNLAGSNNVESDDPLGEGAAISFTECTYSFDSQSSCGVNDTTFIYNAVAKKGAAVAVGSGDAPSYIEFHRCVVDNSTTGWPFEDDPQGEGGAFALGNGTTLVLEDCQVTNNYAGKKGGAITLSSGKYWEEEIGATVIVRNSNFSGNIAELEAAGVINLGEYAAARIEGQGNNFTGNMCGTEGGVLFATINTRVVVEGGIFESNEADEAGGVFSVGGVLNITGGNFSGNKADNGGVIKADEWSTVNLFDGLFEGNDATDGGVVFVNEDGQLFVLGGIYSENEVDNGGGVFWGDDGGDVEIKGGTFTNNKADFGGFIYVEGAGVTSCEGGSVEKHHGVDGGAIYAVEDAVVDWACHLIDNEALSGPAIYARDSANVTVRRVNVSDNEIARGSVIIVVSSVLHTYQVNIKDSTGNPDLSAVQSDGASTFIAEETAFVGFKGETVVYSEGDLFLDDCDFSQSPASTLVYSGSSTTPVIRNAVLGDNNFVDSIEAASTASELPVNASLINVALTCNESGSPCSTGSICLEGDLGVYCQCYVRNYIDSQAALETCLDGDPGGLSLTNKTDPLTTFHPNLLEGDIFLALDAGDGPASTLTSSSTVTPSSDSTQSTITSLLTSGGVIWNVSATPNDFISWTILPSAGLLLPGKNITIRVASLPSADFDGTDTAEFIAHAFGAPDQLEDQSFNSSLSSLSSSKLLQTYEDGADGRLEQEMKVTFYHCISGNFWNYTGGNETMNCELCTNIEGGAEALDCSDPGASTLKLPLRSGYWRATLDTTVVRECFNEGACIGGIATMTSDDYCKTGYEGPFCGVCASGYGRGSANVCHECTEEFKGAMFFILSVAFVLVVVAIVLLGIYLVGGRVAVSQTVYTTRESVRMLHRRSSSLFIRSEVARNRDTTNMERRASGRALSKTASSRVRTISGGSVAVSNPSSNVIASIPSSSLAAPYAVHTGQVTATRGRSDDFRKDGYIDDARGAVPAEAANTGTPGQALLSAYTRVQHSSSNLPIETSPSPTIAARAPTLSPAPASSVPESTSTQGETEDRDKGKDKTAAVIIGEFLGTLPLSKIKIVIVVWQISSAFAEITEVPFPEAYERFLAIIGIFSFDLGWILSAACLTVGLDFYDELLIVTIGPLFLLGLLGITFYLGSRPLKSPSRRGVSPKIRNRIINQDAVGVSSSGATALCSTHTDIKTPEQEASTNTITNIDDNFATNSGATKILPIVTSMSDKDDNDDAPSSRERALTRRRSVKRIWKDGPGDNANSEQAHLWNLFARHTTMTLIILYLIYSTVSTVVFQTFTCKSLDEIGRSFLRADFRIECYTPTYKAYRIYAVIMVCVYPLGIPLAFWYFLARHKTRINPSMDENSKSPGWEDLIVEKKCEKRKDDPTVAPTSFLWAAYYPDRYYFEVCECIRRLLLTGVLVFIHDTPKQVAYSCLFAFISLVAFELLRPHMDQLDRVLYRTGCLVIFFTNFLAMIITADVTKPESGDLAAYAIGLIVVNIVFVVLSISWNTWATIKAMFSTRHMQGATLGLDLIGEDSMDAVATAIKAKGAKGRCDVQEEVKRETKDLEAAPIWEGDPSVAEEPIDINRISSRRSYDETDIRDSTNNPAEEFVLLPPSSMAPRAADTVGDNRSTPEPYRRQYPIRRNDHVLRTWATTPQCPSSTTPVADIIFDRGPRSRGFPYSSRIHPATPSSQNSSQTGIPDLNN